MSERVGAILGGRWRLTAVLGTGSMATVYAATDPDGAIAAIKVLRRGLSGSRAACERFVRESYLTSAVRHPGVVKVHGDGLTDDGCPFLVMDQLDGDTLEATVQRHGGRLPLDQALEIADRVSDVLACVHEAGIVHRDLKPTNVFVMHDGGVKILDFGIARSMLDPGAAKGSQAGNVMGSPSFMSPEQALGARDAVDQRSDVWAFGAILFYVLTGEPVHVAPTLEARLLAAASQQARSIRELAPDLDPGIADVVDRALRYKKAARWPSVRAMRVALHRAVNRPEPGSRPTLPVPSAELRLPEVEEGALSVRAPLEALPPPSTPDVPVAQVPTIASPIAPAAATPPEPLVAAEPVAADADDEPPPSSGLEVATPYAVAMAPVGSSAVADLPRARRRPRRAALGRVVAITIPLAIVAIGGLLYAALSLGAGVKVKASPPPPPVSLEPDASR